MARVTIGLPVYNGQQYLAEAVDSLLAQSFEDFDFIIADNDSSDDTPAICQAYADRDSRIRFVRNESNIGGWRNHNKVLDLATTELFMWAGHDDVWQPTAIERCVELLDRHADAVMARVSARRIGPKGEDLGRIDSLPELSQADVAKRYREALILENTLEHFYGLTRTAAMKATRKLGQFADSDRVLMSELVLQGRVVAADEELYWRREHPSRSTAMYKSRQSRSAWINPGQSAKFPGFPHFREWLEFLKGLVRMLPGTSQGLRCIGAWLRWPIRYRKGFRGDMRYCLSWLISRIRRRP